MASESSASDTTAPLASSSEHHLSAILPPRDEANAEGNLFTFSIKPEQWARDRINHLRICIENDRADIEHLGRKLERVREQRSKVEEILEAYRRGDLAPNMSWEMLTMRKRVVVVEKEGWGEEDSEEEDWEENVEDLEVEEKEDEEEEGDRVEDAEDKVEDVEEEEKEDDEQNSEKDGLQKRDSAIEEGEKSRVVETIWWEERVART